MGRFFLPALLLMSAWPLQAQAGFGSGSQTPVLWLVIGGIGVFTVVAAVVLWRRQEVEDDAADMPPLLFPAAPATRPRQVRAAAIGTPPPGPPGAAARVPTAPHGAAPAASVGVAEPATAPRFPFDAAPAAVRPAPAPPTAVPAGDSLVDGKTIRFHKPVDGTLQILPGRLEIVEGADSGQSIRFVRAGTEAEVTFGRSEGPAYSHIQLRAPTVSRKHARMRYEDAAWQIRNLSQTNPVVVNGEELGVDTTPRVLREGDRIEMGEVCFVYRER